MSNETESQSSSLRKRQNAIAHIGSRQVNSKRMKPHEYSNLVPGRKSLPREDDVQSFRKNNFLRIDNCRNNEERLFHPILSFNELELFPDLMKALGGFKAPTVIQSQCWPIVLAGRDVIGIAETGSGKTLAYSLPILYHLHDVNDWNIRVVILLPTRELANQIAEVISRTASSTNIKTICVYGGASKKSQEKHLKKGVNIVVATPGRLMDLMENTNYLNFCNVEFFVLDEADRMLDMGFEQEIRKVADSLPNGVQTLMFSATWPRAIERIASTYLRDPIVVKIGAHEELNSNKNIKQIVSVVEPKSKDTELKKILKELYKKNTKILIFVLYKKEASRVENVIRREGYNVVGINSDKNQKERSKALESFKNGICQLLVATDVASRGLDIPDVNFVINYTFPLTIENYVHRIGRTARGGKTGAAYTFFTSFDKARAGELIQILEQNKQHVSPALLNFGEIIKVKEPKLGPIDINSQPVDVINFSSDSD